MSAKQDCIVKKGVKSFIVRKTESMLVIVYEEAMLVNLGFLLVISVKKTKKLIEILMFLVIVTKIVKEL